MWSVIKGKVRPIKTAFRAGHLRQAEQDECAGVSALFVTGESSRSRPVTEPGPHADTLIVC
jgi:hypothetical protein